MSLLSNFYVLQSLLTPAGFFLWRLLKMLNSFLKKLCENASKIYLWTYGSCHGGACTEVSHTENKKLCAVKSYNRSSVTHWERFFRGLIHQWAGNCSERPEALHLPHAVQKNADQSHCWLWGSLTHVKQYRDFSLPSGWQECLLHKPLPQMGVINTYACSVHWRARNWLDMIAPKQTVLSLVGI